MDNKGFFFRIILFAFKIALWMLLFTLPFSLIAILYIVIHYPHYQSLPSSALLPIIKTCIDDLLDDFPFFEFISNIITKKISLSNLHFNIQLNDVLKSLICYGLVGWNRRLFNVAKDTLEKTSIIKKIVILSAIYTSWFVLSVFVSDILMNTVFALLERLPLHIEMLEKIIILVVFYVIAILIFMHRAKTPLLYSSVWVLFEKIVFPTIIVLYFSLMNYWAIHIYLTATNLDDHYKIVFPLILCIFVAAGIDALRQKTRLGIIQLFKPTSQN